MVYVVDDIDKFISIEKDWEELQENSCIYNPFLSYTFVFSSWKNIVSKESKSASLYILCVKDKSKEIIAILPCYLTNKRVLYFINWQDADFLGALVKKEYECNHYLFKELCEFIINDERVRSIHLDNLKSDSPLLSYMKYFFSPSFVFASNAFSTIPVSRKRVEEKMPSLHLHAKDKNRLSNILKKCGDMEMKVYRIDESDYPENILQELVDYMISTGQRSKDYFCKGRLDLIKDLYNKELVSIAVVKEGGLYVSASVFYRGEKELINWIIVYRESKHNLTNKLLLLNSFSEEGGGTFNFARGTYSYKLQHFRPIVGNLNTFMYSKGFWRQVGLVASIAKTNMRSIAKHIIKGK